MQTMKAWLPISIFSMKKRLYFESCEEGPPVILRDSKALLSHYMFY